MSAAPSMMNTVALMVRRDLTLVMRHRSDVATNLFFFVIVVSLFPLGVGADMDVLRTIAPGVVWVAALLASMLSLGRMFSADYADGTLEQMLVAPRPLSLVVLGKVIAHWLVTGVPLALVAPLLGLQFGLPAEGLKGLMVSLLLGTPVLSLIGAIGAGLTLGLHGGGVLVSLLVLPLYIPVLIIGAGAVYASFGVGLEAAELGGMESGSLLMIQGAILLVAAVFTPWATATALRISLD